jgi:hypothetical protein
MLYSVKRICKLRWFGVIPGRSATILDEEEKDSAEIQRRRHVLVPNPALFRQICTNGRVLRCTENRILIATALHQSARIRQDQQRTCWHTR